MENTIDLLLECKLQLEYLNEKFGETGTTNALLSKIENRLNDPKKFEHNDDEGFEYTLLREIDKSDYYLKFKKHYTEEIRKYLDDQDGKFVMTHQIAGNIILDITEMIKKLGYIIIKKTT